MNASVRSFRLVCPAQQRAQVRALLSAQGFVFEQEPFLDFAFRLVEEPFPLGRSLAAFFGLIYIQDRSSMLPPIALNPAPGSGVLDCCASPGSKTGLLAQLVGKEGFVLGNEPTRSRLSTLRRNMQTLNLLHVVTCCWPGEALPLPLAGWDFIQLDPPCSGWGTVDKNPAVLKLWKGDKVQPLIALQRQLLQKAAALLRPGGRLVYSTCTTNVEENEKQVRFALESDLDLTLQPLSVPPGFALAPPKQPGCDGVWRIDNASDGQGFFIAAFVKGGDPAPLPFLEGPATPPYQRVPDKILDEAGLDRTLLPQGDVAVFGDAVHFLPRQAVARLPAALRWQGAPLGKVSGGRPLFSPRLRGIAPDSCLPRLVLEKTEEVEGLLQGRSLDTGIAGREAALFWRDLPLGRIRLKNGRALWTEK